MTERTPKPMVEVSGRPFLEYIVRHLASQDFRDLLILTGYLGHHVENHFGDGSTFGVSIRYAREHQPLGTGGAIRAAIDRIGESFLLLYGDSFLPIDYLEVVDAFERAECRGLMVVYSNQTGDTGVSNNVDTDTSGRVKRYQKGTEDINLRYVEAGVLCFRRDVFAHLPANSVCSMESEIFPRLISEQQLSSFATSQRFFDIGTPTRLAEFMELQQC